MLKNYNSFKKLLELGFSPNYISPITKKTILIQSIKYYKDYKIDLRYMQLLLEYGADPNYIIEEDIRNKDGVYQKKTSPIMEASTLSLDMVKLLIKYSADPYRQIGKNKEAAFERSLYYGNINKYEIINYYIDSLKVDVKAPMYIRNNGDTLYIQDYFKKDLHDPRILELKEKLEEKGVDFKNYIRKYSKLTDR